MFEESSDSKPRAINYFSWEGGNVVETIGFFTDVKKYLTWNITGSIDDIYFEAS